jgi:hypothetical protein
MGNAVQHRRVSGGCGSQMHDTFAHTFSATPGALVFSRAIMRSRPLLSTMEAQAARLPMASRDRHPDTDVIMEIVRACSHGSAPGENIRAANETSTAYTTKTHTQRIGHDSMQSRAH